MANSELRDRAERMESITINRPQLARTVSEVITHAEQAASLSRQLKASLGQLNEREREYVIAFHRGARGLLLAAQALKQELHTQT